MTIGDRIAFGLYDAAGLFDTAVGKARSGAWKAAAQQRFGGRAHNVADKVTQARNLSTRKKLAYGAGVVGVSSGAYAWHRRRESDQIYSSPGPYYY